MAPITIYRQDALFDLIKKLSKAEKRNFKLYATRQAGYADAKFIVLFDVLDSMDEYDEQKILKHCPVKKSQLPNMKAHLYRQILVSSRLINVQHNLTMQLREQIDFARILYDKGLYRQSLKLLDKAKKAALSAEQSTIALEIVEIEKDIETLHITRSGITRAEQLSSQTTELCTLIDNTNQLSNISIQLYGLYLKLGYVRSERDLDLVIKFFKHKLDNYDVRTLSFMEKLHLYQAMMWYAYIRHDFVSCFKYSAKVIALFDEHPRMRPIYYDQYLKGYSRYLETLFLTRNYERLSATTKYYEKVVIKEMSELNDHAIILSHLALYFHKINVHFMEGTFKEGIELIPKIEAFLKKYNSNIDMHYKQLFYYKIACLYFGDAQYIECIDYLQRIINTRDTNVRRDLQCFARILNLIAAYESTQDYNLDYQIRSVYSFIVKMNDMHAVQKEIIAFLKRLNRIYASDIQAELQVLYKKMLPYESHPYERRPFFYLDIISWLESKIRGVTVAEVIQEKFRRSLERHKMKKNAVKDVLPVTE